jgi:hypothetical protein
VGKCVGCGQSGGSLFRLCAACKEQDNLLGNLKTKGPKRIIQEPEDDE